MGEINLQEVTVYELRLRGKPFAIGLSEDDLLNDVPRDKRSKQFELVHYNEQVGSIVGEVHDWNQAGGYAQHLKLHWNCPQCDFHQWGDLLPDTPNPCLWYSNCSCIGKWLIRYASPAKRF